MSRGITADVQDAVEKDKVVPVFLAEFQFPTETLRFWTGIGSLSWDSQTWLGSGNLIRFGGIDETSLVEATGIQFQLAGVNSEIITIALDEDIQGRTVNLWLAFMLSGVLVEPDEVPADVLYADDELIADPVGPFEYRMDTFAINDDPSNPTITLFAESYLASLGRPRIRRYTHEDQQIEFPGDLGLEFVASIQNKEIKWGKV